MSLLGMPWVVINLGCEMVYILEQRLKAQGIQQDKGAKVLQDIVRTMFDRSFLSEKLFVSQDMYSLHSTRKIFDRLAHSSIMRLSESSMDKLFDLMVMGAKYQLMCASRLDDMIQVTLRHLGTVQAILATAAAASSEGKVDADVINLVSFAEESTIRFYGTLSIGELALLRQTLARFFQDKRVKVSLFLAEGIQQPTSGKLVAPSCISDQVGLVRSYDDTGRLERKEWLQVNSQKVGGELAAALLVAATCMRSSKSGGCADAGQQPGLTTTGWSEQQHGLVLFASAHALSRAMHSRSNWFNNPGPTARGHKKQLELTDLRGWFRSPKQRRKDWVQLRSPHERSSGSLG
ncbi:organic solute transport protein 1-domain-containing protein [Scenedesmus sp. NREL 46B-D3]|nr:organic solute transport protein 1-domain-containing protein [Scenedesmus sp. NREL 46B-D3]